MTALFAIGLRELGSVFLIAALWLGLGTLFGLVFRWIRRQSSDPRGL